MLLGVISVASATKQHQALGRLKSALDVRLWLSRGRPSRYFPQLYADPMLRILHPKVFCSPLAIVGRYIGLLRILRRTFQKARQDAAVDPEKSNEAAATLERRGDPADPENSDEAAATPEPDDKYKGLRGFRDFPLESSVSGLKEVALPRHLLDLAVMLFIAGIGLYELFAWKSGSGDEGIAYRNVFIVFMITLGVYLLYSWAIRSARILDGRKRNLEFATQALGGFSAAEKLRQLERELATVRRQMDLNARVGNAPTPRLSLSGSLWPVALVLNHNMQCRSNRRLLSVRESRYARSRLIISRKHNLRDGE